MEDEVAQIENCWVISSQIYRIKMQNAYIDMQGKVIVKINT